MLQLEYHRRVFRVFFYRDINQVGETFSRGEFLETVVIVECVDKGDVNRRGEGVFVVVIAV